MMNLQFKTRNIATTAEFLSLAECRHIVDAMQSSPGEPAQVVSAEESILDETLRYCLDHHFPDAFKRPIETRLTAFFDSIGPSWIQMPIFFTGIISCPTAKGVSFVPIAMSRTTRTIRPGWLRIGGRSCSISTAASLLPIFQRSMEERSSSTKQTPSSMIVVWSSFHNRDCWCYFDHL